MKNILILCTGNSCRSIMGEALANHYLSEFGVKAYSSGVQPSGTVNPNAIKALEKEGISTDGLSSKTLDKLPVQDFDLVVTVCDHANETCPMFAGGAKKIHVGFEDPSGGPEEGYTNTLHEIRDVLLPKIKEELGL
jgi:arsenate reductase